MFNRKRLNEILVLYKRDFAEWFQPRESFKWRNIKWFQDHWDVNAENFPEMLEESLSKTGDLLTSRNQFAKNMITGFANAEPEKVRGMFLQLYDEDRGLYERISAFKQKSVKLLEEHGNGAKNHFQDENTISIYLWLRYPDKYYIYKFQDIRNASRELESDYVFEKGAYAANIRNYMAFNNELHDEIVKDGELVQLVQKYLTDSCYPDPEFRTLTQDVGIYISRRVYNREKEEEKTSPNEEKPENQIRSSSAVSEEETVPNYWMLSTNPKIWSLAQTAIGAEKSYALYNDSGYKKRIFKNFLDAKAGDRVIVYESSPSMQITAIAQVSAEEDGTYIRFKKLEAMSSPIAYAQLRDCSELNKMEYFSIQQGSFFKLTEEEFAVIMEMIRAENPAANAQDKSLVPYTKDDFLADVYLSKYSYNRLAAALKKKKNLILEGPPGVGKTYAAKRLAYSIMGVKDENRIEFVQFHQNYSYEDFVMGYRPVGDGFELRQGIFYRFCLKAGNDPDHDYFFIIDEINRGNMSRIFGELLVLIEKEYRGTYAALAYTGLPFSVPKNLYLIGMMNTADRSLAVIDYALRRRFGFYPMEPGFDSEGFLRLKDSLQNETFNLLIEKVKELNKEISADKSLGKGFCIGHSYFCNVTAEECTDEWMKDVVDFDILPTLREYWFDDESRILNWENIFHGVFQ